MELSKGSRKRNAPPKSSRRVRQETELDQKEHQLSSLIFGGNASEKKYDFDAKEKDHESSDHLGLEEEDSKNVAVWKDNDTLTVTVSKDSGDRLKKLRDTRKETKWESNELEAKLRQRYEKTALRASRTKWASVHQKTRVLVAEDDTSENYDVHPESGMLYATKGTRLLPNRLDMVRLKDVNATDPCGAVLRSLVFHPKSDAETPLLMCAGLDKCLRFYSIGQDEESRKVHGIHCKFLPRRRFFALFHIFLKPLQFQSFQFTKLPFCPTQIPFWQLVVARFSTHTTWSQERWILWLVF